MSQNSELTELSACEAVRLLKRREVSPLEMVDAAIRRIEAIDDDINALPIRFFEDARAAARHFEKANKIIDDTPGSLAGLPIAVKDFNDVAGQRTTHGSPIFEKRVATHSDMAVATLVRRGAIPIAKSNVPEFGGANTFNTLFGATRNPWNTDLTAGGSSGGSAAALATGQVWLATGNDLGGSLRIPASYCGIASMRPGVGSVVRPEWMPPFDTLGAEGPMGRTVADMALMLDALAQESPQDPFSHGRPPRSYSQALEAPPTPARIAFSPNLGIGPVDPEVARVCRDATLMLESFGARISDACPDFSSAIETFETQRALLFATLWGDLAQQHADQLPPWILANFRKGLELRADDIIRAERQRADLYRRLMEFFQRFDILVCPTVALPPFPVDQRYPTDIAGQKLDSYIDWMYLTFAVTLTACPVVSVPCGLTASGLPVGLQLIGPPRSEFELIATAKVVESNAGVAENLPISAVK